jgi:hypothetical protein
MTATTALARAPAADGTGDTSPAASTRARRATAAAHATVHTAPRLAANHGTSANGPTATLSRLQNRLSLAAAEVAVETAEVIAALERQIAELETDVAGYKREVARAKDGARALTEGDVAMHLRIEAEAKRNRAAKVVNRSGYLEKDFVASFYIGGQTQRDLHVKHLTDMVSGVSTFGVSATPTSRGPGDLKQTPFGVEEEFLTITLAYDPIVALEAEKVQLIAERSECHCVLRKERNAAASNAGGDEASTGASNAAPLVGENPKKSKVKTLKRNGWTVPKYVITPNSVNVFTSAKYRCNICEGGEITCSSPEFQNFIKSHAEFNFVELCPVADRTKYCVDHDLIDWLRECLVSSSNITQAVTMLQRNIHAHFARRELRVWRKFANVMGFQRVETNNQRVSMANWLATGGGKEARDVKGEMLMSAIEELAALIRKKDRILEKLIPKTAQALQNLIVEVVGNDAAFYAYYASRVLLGVHFSMSLDHTFRLAAATRMNGEFPATAVERTKTTTSN